MKDVDARIARTEEMLAAALRGVSVRAYAGLLGNALDETQPDAARRAEANQIRSWVAAHEARLGKAANVGWIDTSDLSTVGRIFVGQSKIERRIVELARHVDELKANAHGVLASLGFMARPDELTLALAPPSD